MSIWSEVAVQPKPQGLEVFGVWPETLVTPAPQREQSMGTRCDSRCPTVEWRRELVCVLILALTCSVPVGSFVLNERGSSSSASLSEGQTIALLAAGTSPRGWFARSRRGYGSIKGGPPLGCPRRNCVSHWASGDWPSSELRSVPTSIDSNRFPPWSSTAPCHRECNGTHDGNVEEDVWLQI